MLLLMIIVKMVVPGADDDGYAAADGDGGFQVPKGFPYFSVDFGLQGGYAHVIEEENKFPAYFGRVSVCVCGCVCVCVLSLIHI